MGVGRQEAAALCAAVMRAWSEQGRLTSNVKDDRVLRAPLPSSSIFATPWAVMCSAELCAHTPPPPAPRYSHPSAHSHQHQNPKGGEAGGGWGRHTAR